MFQVNVNDKSNFEIVAEKGQLKVNKEVIILDQVNIGENLTNVIYKQRSYNIEIVSFNASDKQAVIKVNGNNYHIKIKDQYDQLLKQLGLDNLNTNKIQQIKAPMPGLVLNVLVSDGDEVKKGDNLLVLEAMKMENMIKSPTDGIIKTVAVKQGNKVEKNELLVSFK